MMNLPMWGVRRSCHAVGCVTGGAILKGRALRVSMSIGSVVGVVVCVSGRMVVESVVVGRSGCRDRRGHAGAAVGDLHI